MTIGKRIKLIRGSLSLKDFAQRIDPAKKSSYDWESGKAMPGASTLEKIHKVFGVNINWLLTGEGEPFLNKNSTNAKDFHKVDSLIMTVPSPESKHTATAMDSFAESISGLREIYDSGDASLIQALEINIRIIRREAHRGKIINAQADQINNLEKKCKEVTQEMESLKNLIQKHVDGSASHSSLKAGNDS